MERFDMLTHTDWTGPADLTALDGSPAEETVTV
jgi:hypothetical protein